MGPGVGLDSVLVGPFRLEMVCGSVILLGHLGLPRELPAAARTERCRSEQPSSPRLLALCLCSSPPRAAPSPLQSCDRPHPVFDALCSSWLPEPRAVVTHCAVATRALSHHCRNSITSLTVFLRPFLGQLCARAHWAPPRYQQEHTTQHSNLPSCTRSHCWGP